MKKDCIQCKKEFEKNYNSSRAYFARQKFCSQKCFGDSRQGKVGAKRSEVTKEKMRLANKNNKSGLENGKNTRFKKVEVRACDKIGGINKYRFLHKWVEKNLGKPSGCSNCGKIGYGKYMHWANISKGYRKELDDWIRLCVKCHYEFDLDRKVLPIKTLELVN